MITTLASGLRAGVVALIGAAALAGPAFAAGDAYSPKHHDWTFSGPFGTFDKEQLQRGFQVYREVCASCHGMKFLSFRNLGQKGGPFYDPDFPDPADNPVVRAIASQYTIVDGPDDVGDMFERPGIVADTFPSPFPNEAAARAANGGAYPPDMSVIVKARHYGADYIASLINGYYEPPEDLQIDQGLYYNPYFAGGKIAMAPQLIEGRLDYAEGQPLATPEQMAEDVSAFLAWASDPHADARKRMGFMAIIYLGVLAVLLWLSYKQIWRNVEH